MKSIDNREDFCFEVPIGQRVSLLEPFFEKREAREANVLHRLGLKGLVVTLRHRRGQFGHQERPSKAQ